MTELPAGNVIAGAEFESTSSNIMQISNSRGIICEMNLKTSHKCSVLIGNETTARITRKDGVVKVEQFEIDGIKPKYPLLISQLNKIGALEDAFGKRRAIKSIKNCKLCDEENNEVIAVRKTHRSVLDIDSKYNVSFLTCFVVGIFMFLSK
ncbi:hypothetical protein GPJ56_004308 [Histomonas meleagridis]|uniref:uncharacterized protein n=1 Tax=Histomonas meleagridis TaxID=135588 RepID=UPI0035598857|nr:hypothetical protein GPJ56_004308 [Histomonas meleagridis]KAH0800477.1 hypothetical protein GO595_006680 [Histomonas meleagridis]